jgi:hypothetical protein
MTSWVRYPPGMATCTFDVSIQEYPYRETLQWGGCQDPWTLHDAVSAAIDEVELSGTFGAEADYFLERRLYGPVRVVGGTFAAVGEKTVQAHGAITFEDTTFERPLSVGSPYGWDVSLVSLVGTRHTAAVHAQNATLTLSDVGLAEDAWIQTIDSILWVFGGDWRDLGSPVVQVVGGSLWMEGTSVSGTWIAEDRRTGVQDGRDRVISLVEPLAATVRYSWLCDHEASAIGGSCAHGYAPCRVERSVLSEPGDAPLVTPGERSWWALDHVTLHTDDGNPGGGWGLDPGSGASIDATRILVWPDGARWARVDPYQLSGDWTPAPLLPPEEVRDRLGRIPTACHPAVPDPEPLGWDASDVPGAFTLPVYRAGARWHAPWLADTSDMGGDTGVTTYDPYQEPPEFTGDGDGVVRMWDCAPDDPQVGGPEVAGDEIDQDCDGVLLCGVDEDEDGFFVLVEILAQSGEACPVPVEPLDPDDDNPCVVPEDHTSTCVDGHTGVVGHTGTVPTDDSTIEERPIAGLAGSGCATAPMGPGWLAAALGASLLRRRRRAR